MGIRNMIRFTLVLLAFTCAGAARADSLFTYVTGSSTYTFTLPDSPTPASSTATNSFTVNGSITTNGTTTADSLTFYTTLFSGGFSDTAKSISVHGSQLFSGTVSAPTFTRGTYSMYSDVTQLNRVGTLTIAQAPASPAAVAATPEPSSLVLLGTGLVGLSVALRRRSRMASLTGREPSAS